MKINAKFFGIMVIAIAFCTSVLAGPPGPPPKHHRHHDKGNKGIRLATDIVNLVGAVLNPKPTTVVVAPPPPPPRTVVVAPPPPPPRTVVVTPPPRHHRPAPVRVHHNPHRGHRR